MKKAEISIGGHYIAKVSTVLAVVRIDRVCPNGGWEATNTATGRQVRIRSAAKLRRNAKAPDPNAPAPVRERRAPVRTLCACGKPMSSYASRCKACDRLWNCKARAEALNVVERGVCPLCGQDLRRNSSMTGWWQCSQFGSEGFRADATRPGCGYQIIVPALDQC